MSESEGELVLEVQDDGRGFDPNLASEGFGLAGTRERVSLAGGTLDIDSNEHGTLIRASLPAAGATPHADRSSSQALSRPRRSA